MNALQRYAGGAATAFAALMLAAPAYADGMRGSIKDKPEPRRCTLSANVGLTTDYVFRGYSQSAEGAAIQGGFDATCGMFYAGVWASSLDWGGDGNGSANATIELDVYAGFKGTAGRIAWDVGVIYYTYPNSIQLFGGNNEYVELKVALSTEVWKGGTAGVTLFYSPEYQYETGAVVTVEGSFAQALPKVGMFTPTFSTLVGYQQGDSGAWKGLFANGDSSYMYWNAGVTFGFHEKWSLDVRYWDTNISDAGGFCSGATFQCDERIVGTLKFTY